MFPEIMTVPTGAVIRAINNPEHHADPEKDLGHTMTIGEMGVIVEVIKKEYPEYIVSHGDGRTTSMWRDEFEIVHTEVVDVAVTRLCLIFALTNLAEICRRCDMSSTAATGLANKIRLGISTECKEHLEITHGVGMVPHVDVFNAFVTARMLWVRYHKVDGLPVRRGRIPAGTRVQYQMSVGGDVTGSLHYYTDQPAILVDSGRHKGRTIFNADPAKVKELS